MEEEVTIQTADEVSSIDYRKNINDTINEQAEEMQNNMDAISEQLDIIIDNTNSSAPSPVKADLSEITDAIENIDTTIVEAQTQDILSQLNSQQKQIDDINIKLDLIISKLQ